MDRQGFIKQPCFIDSLDYGGPRREFLTIFLRELSLLLLQDGNLVDDERYLDKRYYYYFGLMAGKAITCLTQINKFSWHMLSIPHL